MYEKEQKEGTVFRAVSMAIPAVLITAGVMYAVCIYMGYAKGRHEYRNIEDQYTTGLPGHGNVPDDTGSDMPDVHTADQGDRSEERDGYSEDTTKTQQEGNGLEMGNKHFWGPLIAKLPPEAPERKQ